MVINILKFGQVLKFYETFLPKGKNESLNLYLMKFCMTTAELDFNAFIRY